jgi:3-oxoacyl-[acyl-carrier-protein] synthase-3
MGSPVYITAVGTYLPEQVLSNEQIVAGMPWLDTNADWIREHTGIRARHVAASGEHATDLGLRAACDALQHAQVRSEDTGMVMLATNTAQFVYPAGAALIQHELAAKGHAMPQATALDLQQGCASFVAGIILAAAMIQSGTLRQVLVVGADVSTRMLDWTDRNAVLLGDGASACIVADRLPDAPRATPALQILSSFMRTAPDLEAISQRSSLDDRNHPLEHMAFAAGLDERVTRQALYSRLGTEGPRPSDRFFHMDGRRVYRFVRRTVTEPGFLEVLRRAGLIDQAELAQLTAGDPSGADGREQLRAAIGRRIDRFVPHGANMALDQELADQMRIPYERMALTLPEHGNTSTASVGIALDRVLRGSLRYQTVVKRDGDGKITVPARDVVVEQMRVGHVALLLSFGAGASWNFIVARAV